MPSAVNLPPGSVAVVSNFYASLFGGPLSQLLKCLTVVKVCAEFKKNGIATTPVCFVRQCAPPGFSQDKINLIDRSSKIHCIKISGREAGENGAVADCKGIEILFNEVEKIFPDGDVETLSALKNAFIPDKDFVSSCARWIKYLMKDYGVTIVENESISLNKCPDNFESQFLPQSMMLPVAAFVVDSNEIAEEVKDAPMCEYDGITRPIIKHLPSVTISNARIMKTLRRYGLDLTQILEGNERVMDYVRESLKSDAPGRLLKLKDETAVVLNELKTASFFARGERSCCISRARSSRIIYQLEKIQKLSRAALADKEKAAEYRIRKACDFLAPLGGRQQDALGCAQIPLYYGMAGLRALYERLDITTPNHQLIEMD